MKRKKVLLMATAFSLLMATTALAGTWQAGTGANQGKWWYDNGNGAYTSNGWQWIDGNGDGVAESYYFDENGWLLTNTSTPDGYKVDANGAWVQNGVIQTKVMGVTAEPINESDFVVSGDNSITRNNPDNSIISHWERSGYSASLGGWSYHMFVTGDSLTTARGISLGNTKSDVIEKYGAAVSQKFDKNSDRWYQVVAPLGYADSSIIAESASIIEYNVAPYGIRFYFDQTDKLIGVVYFKDKGNAQTAGENLIGTYNYSQTILYVLNEETQKYEVYGKTPEHTDFDWVEGDSAGFSESAYEQYTEMVDERYQQFGMPMDFAPEFRVLESSNDIIKVTHSNAEENFYFKKSGETWRYEGYESNGNYKSEPDDSNTLAFTDGGKLIECSYGSDEYGNFFPAGTNWYQEMIYLKE